MAKAVKQTTEAEVTVQPKQTGPKDYVFAVGRRREAVARVRVYDVEKESVTWGGEQIVRGNILVNELPIGKYFSSAAAKSAYEEPLRVTNTLGKYIITAKVQGGGKKGQLDALIHGLARALDAIDKEKFRPILKKRGFLTRDARTRERRKIGTGGKARRQKQSPKR